MPDTKNGIWTTSNKNMFQTGQIVNQQGNIVPGQTYGSLPMGDWKDSSAYRAQAISQAEQRAYDLSLWQYQQAYMNDYNSYKKQMERAGEAGLNPFLIYNQQQTASPVSMHTSSPLKASSNYGRTVDKVMSATQGTLQGLAEIFQLVQQGRMADATVAQQSASARLTQEQAKSLDIQNRVKEWYYFGVPSLYEGGPGPQGNVNVYDVASSPYGKQQQSKTRQSEEQERIMKKRLEIYAQELKNMGATESEIQERTKRLQSAYSFINGIENDFLRTLAYWLFDNASLPSFGFSKRF